MKFAQVAEWLNAAGRNPAGSQRAYGGSNPSLRIDAV